MGGNLFKQKDGRAKSKSRRTVIVWVFLLLSCLGLTAACGAGGAGSSGRKTKGTLAVPEWAKEQKNMPKQTKEIRVPDGEIQGVNLGSWLVLERWMVPELFEENGSDAKDEYHFMDDLGARKEAVMRQHYETFITEADFTKIKALGITHLRIPVGYWIFDGAGHFVRNIEYLDKAFDWAEKHGLKILIDLHAVRDSQNGFDNSGLIGSPGWHKKQANIDETVALLGRLAERYKDAEALFGIELLNEPSRDIPMDVLRKFYKAGYDAVMKYLDHQKHWVVIHDSFRLTEWNDFMREDTYDNVIMDTHMYYVFDNEDDHLSYFQELDKLLGPRLTALRETRRYFPVVVGEWSLGMRPEQLTALGTPERREAALRAFASAQITVYEESAGWFFWSYKQSPKATGDGSGWSFSSCVDKGLLPADFAPGS